MEEELTELDRLYFEVLLPQEQVVLAALTKLQSDEAHLQATIEHATTDRRTEWMTLKVRDEAAAEARLREALFMDNNDDDDDDTNDDDIHESTKNDPKRNDTNNKRGSVSSSSSSSNNSAFGRLKTALLTMDDDNDDDDDDGADNGAENGAENGVDGDGDDDDDDFDFSSPMSENGFTAMI
jgi:hypothetical protein